MVAWITYGRAGLRSTREGQWYQLGTLSSYSKVESLRNTISLRLTGSVPVMMQAQAFSVSSDVRWSEIGTNLMLSYCDIPSPTTRLHCRALLAVCLPWASVGLAAFAPFLWRTPTKDSPRAVWDHPNKTRT